MLNASFPFQCFYLTLLPAQVTRKVIRRCVSSDGVETEQVRVDGSAQQPVNVALGDGYSKVMKRTVLKSEGHQTEVCDDATHHEIQDEKIKGLT